jgi:uncharacterized membrane protein SpoIIM required for sporulation
MIDIRKDLAPIAFTLFGAMLVGIGIGYVGGSNIVYVVMMVYTSSASSTFVGTASAHSKLAEFLAIACNNIIFVAVVGVGTIAFNKYGRAFLFLISSYVGGFVGTVIGMGTVVLGAPLTLAAIVPHGVFELVAVTIGFAIGHHGVRQVRQGVPRRDTYIQNAKAIAVACVPLLFLAAAIETYITPIVMKLVV